jgi:predicted nucleic acid-binding protein
VKYLFDTNVVSELYKLQCDPAVRDFVQKTPQEDTCLSVVSVGEIVYGIKRLSDKKKKLSLTLWLNQQVTEWFKDRVLPITAEVMTEWGILCAAQHRTLPFMDSLLAATARAHRLILVTRNARDFQGLDVDVLDPWES